MVLAPYLHGDRYSSYGRHFTDKRLLEHVVARWGWGGVAEACVYVCKRCVCVGGPPAGAQLVKRLVRLVLRLGHRRPSAPGPLAVGLLLAGCAAPCPLHEARHPPNS